MKNVYIHPETVIGKNFSVEPGARIGVRGLALDRYGESMEKFRFKDYAGKVVIGNDVHIGANTCVERGVTGDTVIGDGTKIDLLCCIGHDVKIGQNCRITPLCCILGYVEIGDNTFIGAATAVRNRIKIGNNVYVGMGSLIIQDVPNNMIIYGRPPNITTKVAKVMNHEEV